MNTAEVAEIATLVRETYSPFALDTGVTEASVIEELDGSRALVLPQNQMFEPARSLRLVDATAVGFVLVITFTWIGDNAGTIFVMPFDTRDLELDLNDEIAVRTFLSRHVEFTLGGPRESWEPARATRISHRLSVVRPWTADQAPSRTP